MFHWVEAWSRVVQSLCRGCGSGVSWDLIVGSFSLRVSSGVCRDHNSINCTLLIPPLVKASDLLRTQGPKEPVSITMNKGPEYRGDYGVNHREVLNKCLNQP